MITIFSGLIGNCGSSGQTRAYMQYFSCLRDLGRDVYYLEDFPARFVWGYGHKVADIDSRAEFLEAKNGYLTTRNDWSSNRSVCYLAAGRPVSMRDTGLDDWIPKGEGIVASTNLTEAYIGNGHALRPPRGEVLSGEIFRSGPGDSQLSRDSGIVISSYFTRQPPIRR